jgi:hypothetical protein
VIGFVLLGLAILLAWRGRRLEESWLRAAAQGSAVLGAALGIILLLRRPGSAWQLPGYGQRRWHQP